MYAVYGPDKEIKMQTAFANLLPLEHLDDMLAIGYTFKKDNVALTKSQIRSEVNVRVRSFSEITTAPAGKPVIVCVDTGIEYASQSAAARALKIDPAQVSDSIKTGRPRSGYTFIRRYI